MPKSGPPALKMWASGLWPADVSASLNLTTGSNVDASSCAHAGKHGWQFCRNAWLTLFHEHEGGDASFLKPAAAAGWTEWDASDLPRRDAALFSKVKKDIEVSRNKAEQSQQQRYLSPVMNAMIGCVLHELSHWH
jgi:hypothetical protein